MYQSHITLSSSWQLLPEVIFQVFPTEDASQRANNTSHFPGALDVEPKSNWPLSKCILIITLFSNLGRFSTDIDQGDAIRHRNRILFPLHIKHCSQIPTLFPHKIQKLYLLFNGLPCSEMSPTLDWITWRFFEVQDPKKVRPSLYPQDLLCFSLPALFNVMPKRFLYTTGHQDQDSLKSVCHLDNFLEDSFHHISNPCRAFV